MKVIFLGTPNFAAKVLKALVASRHKVLSVVTQPDRISARGNKTVIGAVKEYALSVNLPVLQYESISKQGEDALKSLDADIMVTCAYGQILRQNILDVCKFGVINVHASLLPKYRGASPVQWALINGDTLGVSIMQTELGVDTGAVILQRELSRRDFDDCDEALNALADIGAELLIEALDLIESGKAVFTKQDESYATHCRMLTRDDAKIDFSLSAKDLVNRVRGLNPWPSAQFNSPNGVIKILKAESLEGEAKAGEIVSADLKNGIVIGTGKGLLRILKLQPENGKAMDARCYLVGKKLPIGQRVMSNE